MPTDVEKGEISGVWSKTQKPTRSLITKIKYSIYMKNNYRGTLLILKTITFQMKMSSKMKLLKASFSRITRDF